ncbi:MAG: hypothetical protein LBS20_16005 [Prevotella sp.]|jgi:hypothetical protein|nr:hypothetical protein [Prevotella sp.]
MNNVFLRWMYILILCLASVGTYGQQQTYPVQVYTQLAPPYTAHIPAYYTGTQAKLKVMLINTDMQQPLVKVYLRMKILSSSFSAVTPPEVYTPQIELQAGMPLTLSLNDLEPYFKKENLRVSGGQSEFYRTQMLPDNFYRFYFEAYEVGTNRLVSNTKTGFAQAMIASGEPPVLNLPQKGSVIKENNIPSIMFSWTPKHMNSIAAAYGTEYDISLVEIYDKQVAPEAAFDYSRVLYTETTKSTSFIHTVAQPLLIPGMRYAWRVQAKAREGVDEISVFKNNGYSPVSWFDYTADCKTVQSCGAIYENGHVDISWQDVGAMEYTVEYRKKGTSRWYTGTINKPLLSQLYNLQAGKDYEYRIGSRCVAGDAFRYNDLQAFHIPDRQENGPNCGLMPDISLTNRTPARELQSGMPVLVGDFPVFITKVSGSGRFIGEGYVGIPYIQGAQVAVTFKDIIVNTDNRLVEGFFETKYDTKNNNLLFDADQYQTGGKGVGDIRSGEEQAAFKVDYTINPDIKALPLKADGTKDEVKEGTDYTISKGENGKYTFILTDSEGKEHKVEADSMPATIEDKEGNTYEVNEKGEVKPVSKVSEIKLDNATRDTQSKFAVLSFKATANTKYALDEYRDVYDKVTEYKDQYKAEGTAITASAKFMLPGASDEIAVYIKENNENKLLPEKVRFVTGKGREYPATYDNQTKGWTLTIVGGQANDGQELYAVQDIGDDKYETLGKLNIFTYEPLERKVTLVPVNGAMNGLDKQTVQNGLNEIYGRVGIHWTVNVLEKPFSYTPKNGSTFNVTGSGLLSMFTDDMKAINEAFKQSGEYQEDGLYLFVIGDKASESGTEGDMPLGSQFGYLFPNATIRTIAHEVGHGAFNLEHPFDRPVRNSFPQKGMLEYNLMDYPTKDAEKWTELVKLQWDQTRAPGHVIGLFQKDKSGMSDRLKDIDSFLTWIKSNIGLKDVQYNKHQFYESHAWFDVPNESKQVKAIYYVDLYDSGTLNLDKKESGLLPSIGLEFNLNNEYYNGFYFKIKYSDKDETAIRIWCYSYEDFEKLLKYLDLQITDKSKEYIVELYKKSLENAGNDCDKLDVIYETVPDFVLETIDDKTLYRHLEILGECSFGNHSFNKLWWKDTDEKKAVLNILKSFDADWFYKKVNSSPVLLEKVLDKTGIASTYAEEIIKTLLDKAASNWEENDLNSTDCFLVGTKDIKLTEEIIRGSLTAHNTGFQAIPVLASPINADILTDYSMGYFGLSGSDDDSELLRRLGLDNKIRMSFPVIGNNPQYIVIGGCGDLTEGVYNFGNEITQGLSNPLMCTRHIDKRALDPIIVIFEDGNEQIVPAIIAKWYLKEYGSSYKMQILNLGLTVVLPEALIKPATLAKWSKLLKGKNAINTVKIDETLLAELNALKTSEISSYVQSNLQRLLANRSTVWEMGIARGNIIEEIYTLTKYKGKINLNTFKANFPALDFADDLIIDGKQLVSMKSYHPYSATNRTLDNFESTLKTHINQLDKADLTELTNVLKRQGVNADLTNGEKVLTIVVKEGQWDVQQLKYIVDKLKESNINYRKITVNIETF